MAVKSGCEGVCLYIYYLCAVLVRLSMSKQVYGACSTCFCASIDFIDALIALYTSSSAMAEGPRDALVSRNSATTKYLYRIALFA